MNFHRQITYRQKDGNLYILRHTVPLWELFNLFLCPQYICGISHMSYETSFITQDHTQDLYAENQRICICSITLVFKKYKFVNNFSLK